MSSEIKVLQQKKLQCLLQESFCRQSGCENYAKELQMQSKLLTAQIESLLTGVQLPPKCSSQRISCMNDCERRKIERSEILNLLAGKASVSRCCNINDLTAADMLQKWYIEMATNQTSELLHACRNVEFTDTGRLRFNVLWKGVSLRIVIMLLDKTSASTSVDADLQSLPSSCSTDGTVRVASSICLSSSLADSIAFCIEKRLDAVTMLQDAIFRTVEQQLL